MIGRKRQREGRRGGGWGDKEEEREKSGRVG